MLPGSLSLSRPCRGVLVLLACVLLLACTVLVARPKSQPHESSFVSTYITSFVNPSPPPVSTDAPVSAPTPVSTPVAEPRMSYFELNVTFGTGSPDCVDKSMFFVNGVFPGPAIRAQVGEWITVVVRNLIPSENIVVHFHGILQQGTPFYDGGGTFTQNLIAPGEAYRYRLFMDRPGTFYYHAHHGFQDTSLYGPMIIEDPTDPAEIGYDDERILMIGDWWQKPHSQLENETLSSVGFDWKGDSILTNGKGLFQGACSSPGHSLEVVTVDRNRRYRFRIINTGTLHQLAFRIAQHRMHIVEVEGQLVEPLEVDYLELSPGQRYSVLVTTDQSPGDYWMNSVPRYLPMDNVTGPSILRYVGGVETLEAFDLPVASSLPSFPLEKNNWVTAQLTSKFSARRPMPSQPDLTLVFEIGSSINNVSFAPPAPGELPLLEYAYQRRLPANQASRWIDLGNNTVVDIVLQAIVNDVGICDSHPWHMHGHGFWELGSGSGKFEDGLAETPAAPVFRDTSVLYAYVDPEEQGRLVEGTPCGWRHIRMLTNNPGLWALHCHMTVHVMKGLAVAFGVDLEHLPPKPASMLAD